MGPISCPSCEFTTDDVDAMVEHRVGTHPVVERRTEPEPAPTEARPVVPGPLPTGAAAPTEAPGVGGSSPARRRPPVAELVVGAVLLVLVAGAALYVLVLRPSQETHTIEGTIGLLDLDADWDEGQPCSGSGGYDDMAVGADVTITDGEGKTIAVGELTSSEADASFGCTFELAVDDVPRADFYEVEVSHRSGLTYSYDDLVDQEWTVELSLGEVG